MSLILECQEILPKMRAVLVDWMVCKCIGCVTKCNYLSIVLLGGRPPPVPHAAGDPFQHCRHSGQVLKDRQLSSLATERKLWQNVSSVGSELLLAGICRKRSPASAARNFSWWGSPVCSLRPSKPDHLKIVKRFCWVKNPDRNQHFVLRYEEIYAPEIKDFVYITGILHLFYCFGESVSR